MLHGNNIGSEKVCAGCRKSLPADLSNFYKRTRANGRAYLSSNCQSCIKTKRAEYCEANPDVVRESNAKSFAEHGHKYNAQRRRRRAENQEVRAAMAESNRQWVAANKDYIRVWKQAYRAENQERVKALSKAKYARNRDKSLVAAKNGKARRKGAEGKFTADDLDRKLIEQDGRCFWCKCCIAGGYHADHFLPLIQGGSNHQYNIVLACQECNLSRGKKLPAEFFSYMRWLEENRDEIMKHRVYIAQKMREHRARKAAKASADS